MAGKSYTMECRCSESTAVKHDVKTNAIIAGAALALMFVAYIIYLVLLRAFRAGYASWK